MLLDQQFPMERAFLSPYLLRERLGGEMTVAGIATLDPDALEAAFRGPPALHRYPTSMAQRTQAMCQVIADDHRGDAGSVWRSASDGKDLYKRLRALPGFGEAKARIFVGVVGQRLGEGPPDWKDQAATWPSIADVDSFEKVAALREQKRALKAAHKAAEKGS